MVTVAKASEIEPGTGKVVEINGRPIALFNVDGTFFAIDNTCLHRGGPLGEGILAEHVVTCPWHGWKYDITTGKNEANPSLAVACYRVQVEGDEIRIEL